MLVLGIFLVISIAGGSRRFESFLQRNGVSEPVSRRAKLSGYALATLFAFIYLAYAVSLIAD